MRMIAIWIIMLGCAPVWAADMTIGDAPPFQFPDWHAWTIKQSAPGEVTFTSVPSVESESSGEAFQVPRGEIPTSLSLDIKAFDLPRHPNAVSGAGLFIIDPADKANYSTYLLTSDNYFLMLSHDNDGFHFGARVWYSGIVGADKNTLQVVQNGNGVRVLVNGREMVHSTGTQFRMTNRVGVFLHNDNGDGRVVLSNFRLNAPVMADMFAGSRTITRVLDSP